MASTVLIDKLLATVIQLKASDLIITVGFLLATATGDAAKTNTGTKYAIVDSTAQDANGKTITLDNVKPISFDTVACTGSGTLAGGTVGNSP